MITTNFPPSLLNELIWEYNFHSPVASVTETFFTLHFDQFTGKVTLCKDQVVKVIFFRKGTPIFVDSSIRSETLGQMLLEQGKLSEEQYRIAIEKMKTEKKRQGEVIVELGYLSGFEVYEALQIQMERKIQNCFLLEGAEMTSEEGAHHLEGVPDLPVDFFRIYLDTYSSIIPPGSTSNLSEVKALRLSTRGKVYLESKALKPSEVKIVHMLDGKRNASQIVEGSQGDADEGLAFLEALFALSFIELTELPPQRYTIPASQVKKELPPETSSPERRVIEIGSQETASAPQKSSPVYMWALKLEKPLYELLNLTVSENKFQAKKNYDGIVRELHLDDIDGHYEEKDRKIAEAVFDRLALAITVLSDDKRKQNYLKELAARKPEQNNPAPEILAEVAAQKSRVLAMKKQFEKAEQELKKAAELVPKESSYHVELAELILQRSVAKKEPVSSNVEQHLRQALKINSSDEQAYFVLGVIAKLHGDTEKAKNYFSKVVQLKPSHVKASAELRLLLRREEDKKSQSPFLNLFKKK